MIFSYARVSTKTQARDGNSLDAQQAALTAAGAEKIYTDTFTGTKMDRPEWDRLRAQLRRGDVLIVTRLDRLARSESQASGMITGLCVIAVVSLLLYLVYRLTLKKVCSVTIDSKTASPHK